MDAAPTGKSGYSDAAALACGGDPGCLAQQWTIGNGRRIDFLFGRNDTAGGAATFSAFRTITFEAAGAAAQQVTGATTPRATRTTARSPRARTTDHRASSRVADAFQLATARVRRRGQPLRRGIADLLVDGAGAATPTRTRLPTR